MTNSFADLEEAEAIIIIGSNTSEAHPIAALHIKRALRRGAKLIVIDPRRIDMARRADLHLQLLPGTNVAVLNSLMHVILEEGMTDAAFIAERTENYEALSEILAHYTPELVEQDLRRARRRDPRGGAPLRERRQGRHLLLDGHHPALARHRATCWPSATWR